MAQSQVATPVPDVGKLRPVLDYIPCETCLDMYTPEQDYYCAICPRLVRDVVVRRTALGSDEAVQVIAPEDFSMAKDLRDRIQSQELELQEAREKLAAVARREMDLQADLARLQEDLVRVRKEKEEAQLVPFEFVGVRESDREEGIMEFGEDEADTSTASATALAWEPAPEESGEPAEWQQAPTPQPEPTPQPTTTPAWEPVEEDAEEAVEAPTEADLPDTREDPAADAPAFEPTQDMPPPPTPAPRPAAAPAATADDAIARIEAEIAKIEEELQQVAEQEKHLSGGEAPKRKKKGKK